MNIATETLLKFYNDLVNEFGHSDYDKHLLEKSISSIEVGAVITYDIHDRAAIDVPEGE